MGINIINTEQYGLVSEHHQFALGSAHDIYGNYYSLNIKYTVQITESNYSAIKFNLKYTGYPISTDGDNVAWLVSQCDFRYGIGSDSAPSSYNIFNWDINSQTANNLIIYGNFIAGNVYYIWLSYKLQHNCYVYGVEITSLSGEVLDNSVVPVTASSKTLYINLTKQTSGTTIVGYQVSGGFQYRVRHTIQAYMDVAKLDVVFNFASPFYDFVGTQLKAGITSSDSVVPQLINQTPTIVPSYDVHYDSSTQKGTVTITQNLSANTNYYLWIWSENSAGHQATIDSVSITGARPTYTVRLPQDTAEYYIEIPGTSDRIVTVNNGADFQFSVLLKPGYIHGNNFAVRSDKYPYPLTMYGNTYIIENIMSDHTITVEGIELGGLIYISNGSGWDAYQVYIANGSGWDHYMPYVANGSYFDLCT